MFAYCGNNPVIRKDSNGKFWEELLEFFEEAIKEASAVFATAGGVALADSPAIGPADVVALIIAGGAFLYCVGKATYQAIIAPSPTISLSKADTDTDEKADAIVITDEAEARRYNYWAADLVGSQVVVSTPLTFSEACVRVACGGNIMCRNQEAALAIVVANNYRNAVGPEKGCGNNYYWHYHPTRNHTGYKSVHIWYYSEA